MNCTTKQHIFQPLKPSEILSIVILPYVRFSDVLRLEILEAPYVSFVIAADEGVGDPKAFDQSTLHWALQQARAVVVRAGAMPSDLRKQQAVFESFRRVIKPHCVRGGRVVYVNVKLDDTDRWLEHVRSLGRPETQVSLIISAEPEVMA
jgi:hypothetical protein